MANLRRVLRCYVLGLFIASLFVLCNSLGTFKGLARLKERHRRAAAATVVSPTYSAQARYAYPTSANTYQSLQQPSAASSSAYLSSSYPQSAAYLPSRGAASYPQQSYPSGAYPQAVQQQSSLNPGYNAAALYGSPTQYGSYAAAPSIGGYNPSVTGGATNRYQQVGVPTGSVPNGYPQVPVGGAVPTYGSYPAGAYQVSPQSPQMAQQYPSAGQQQQQQPAQYNFNGYNPYANIPQQQGSNNNGYGNYPAQQGRAAVVAPVVQVTTPSPNQFELVEFCKKPDREPRCTKNSFGMCDYQDNYPSEVATEFYGYWKSRINAMATDYDYSNSDQYDTGFGTQQNKLIDFVHEIFEDNEFGSLPGVPPQRKGLCVEVSDTIQPGWARTSRNRYMVIMNSNNVKQSVRAGICRNTGKGCQTVPGCYKSECRQRYRYDTLLVFDPCSPAKPPMLELFKIPDGCECFVLQDEPDITQNLASVPNPKIVAQSTKTNTKGRTSDFANAALHKANDEAVQARVPTTATTATTTTKAGTSTQSPPTSPTTTPSTTPSTTTSSTTPLSTTTSASDALKAL